MKAYLTRMTILNVLMSLGWASAALIAFLIGWLLLAFCLAVCAFWNGAATGMEMGIRMEQHKHYIEEFEVPSSFPEVRVVEATPNEAQEIARRMLQEAKEELQKKKPDLGHVAYALQDACIWLRKPSS